MLIKCIPLAYKLANLQRLTFRERPPVPPPLDRRDGVAAAGDALEADAVAGALLGRAEVVANQTRGIRGICGMKREKIM